MKKITLLCMLLVTSLGFSQELPFNFEGTLHGFIGDGGPGVTNGPGNDVLQAVAGVAPWDNVQVTFASPIDLSDDANNTIRFTIQSTTAASGEVHQHGISFQGGGGSLEANFQTTGTDVLNVELNFNAGLGSREKMVIFTDVGNLGGIAATGGQAGNDTSGLSGTYIIDNISIGPDPVDNVAPTAFTATIDAIGAFGVEVLLNATDDSGSVDYDISWNSGANSVQTTGTSGVEKSFTIPGLTPSTNYDFVFTAADATGNTATNTVNLTATTTADASNFCAGQTADYAYTYETLASGTEVKVTFELLNTVSGLATPSFSYEDTTPITGVTLVSGQKYEATVTGLENGNELSIRAHFVWAAGGQLFTDYRSYVTGDDCSGSAGVDTENLLNVSVSPSPAKNELRVSAQDMIKNVTIYNLLGKRVKNVTLNKNEGVIDVSNLNTGIYILKYTINNTVGTKKFIKE